MRVQRQLEGRAQAHPVGQRWSRIAFATTLIAWTTLPRSERDSQTCCKLSIASKTICGRSGIAEVGIMRVAASRRIGATTNLTESSATKLGQRRRLIPSRLRPSIGGPARVGGCRGIGEQVKVRHRRRSNGEHRRTIRWRTAEIMIRGPGRQDSIWEIGKGAVMFWLRVMICLCDLDGVFHHYQMVLLQSMRLGR
jgi:hypothetical protein